MESAIDTQHGHSFVSLARSRSVLDETRDWSRADFLGGGGGNRMRLLRKMEGETSPPHPGGGVVERPRVEGWRSVSSRGGALPGEVPLI